MTDKKKTIGTWYGKPLVKLTKKELLKLVEWSGKEIVSLRKEIEVLEK